MKKFSTSRQKRWGRRRQLVKIRMTARGGSKLFFWIVVKWEGVDPS